MDSLADLLQRAVDLLAAQQTLIAHLQHEIVMLRVGRSDDAPSGDMPDAPPPPSPPIADLESRIRDILRHRQTLSVPKLAARIHAPLDRTQEAVAALVDRGIVRRCSTRRNGQVRLVGSSEAQS